MENNENIGQEAENIEQETLEEAIEEEGPKQKTYDVVVKQSLDDAAVITGIGSFIKGSNTTITIIAKPTTPRTISSTIKSV